VNSYNSGSDVWSEVEQEAVGSVGFEVHGNLAERANRQHVLGAAHLQLGRWIECHSNTDLQHYQQQKQSTTAQLINDCIIVTHNFSVLRT